MRCGFCGCEFNTGGQCGCGNRTTVIVDNVVVAEFFTDIIAELARRAEAGEAWWELVDRLSPVQMKHAIGLLAGRLGELASNDRRLYTPEGRAAMKYTWEFMDTLDEALRAAGNEELLKQSGLIADGATMG